MVTEHKLTVSFIHKVKGHGNRIIRETISDKSYSYYGRTKKECISKAKEAYRYNASYHKFWSKETN